MKKKTWRMIHRLTGLFTLIFLIFYAFSGVMLNHRKYFDNFMSVTTTAQEVAMDPQLLTAFMQSCQQVIGRDDTPEIIFIRDGKAIEIRYGRHDPVLYRIRPDVAILETDTRTYHQPWHGMKWLHVAYQTSPIWVWVTDLVGVVMLVMSLSALFCFHYRKADLWAVGLSCALFLVLLVIG